MGETQLEPNFYQFINQTKQKKPQTNKKNVTIFNVLVSVKSVSAAGWVIKHEACVVV